MYYTRELESFFTDGRSSFKLLKEQAEAALSGASWYSVGNSRRGPANGRSKFMQGLSVGRFSRGTCLKGSILKWWGVSSRIATVVCIVFFEPSCISVVDRDGLAGVEGELGIHGDV